MAKMRDIHCSFVMKLGGSMLLHSTDICVISGLRGVHIILRHFFVTTLLYTNIRKKFPWTKNLESLKNFSFFLLFFVHISFYIFSNTSLLFMFYSYYFIATYIISIKNCYNKEVSEYRPWPAPNTLWADDTSTAFVDPLCEPGAPLSF